MAFTLYTQSFGPTYANGSVFISESVSGLPATILATPTGGLVNTQGQATLDSGGNLAVYIDTAKTYNIRAFDGTSFSTSFTYLTNTQLNAGATGIAAASPGGILGSNGDLAPGALTPTQSNAVQLLVSGAGNPSVGTYDGSNRVTFFSVGTVTFTVTGWGTSTVTITGSDGSIRTMTLDGSGRFQTSA